MLETRSFVHCCYQISHRFPVFSAIVRIPEYSKNNPGMKNESLKLMNATAEYKQKNAVCQKLSDNEPWLLMSFPIEHFLQTLLMVKARVNEKFLCQAMSLVTVFFNTQQ